MKRHCGMRLGNQVGVSGAGDEGHEQRLTLLPCRKKKVAEGVNSGDTWSESIGKKSLSAHVRWCDPDFLHAASDRFACAAFCKESRMEFASSTSSTGNPGEHGAPVQRIVVRSKPSTEDGPPQRCS